MGELNNVDLEVVPISAEQTYLVCGRAKQYRLRRGSYLSRASMLVCETAKHADLEVVPISAEQTYMVCRRAKQYCLRRGSFLSRASMIGLWES